MLSRSTKARIKKNKARRIQCRTENGRDLLRLVRTTKRRVANQAVDYLLKLSEQYQFYASSKIDSTRKFYFPVSTDEDSTNPNNCTTCGHKQNADDSHCSMFKDAPAAHCYMFKAAPTDVCMQHTGRGLITNPFGISMFLGGPMSLL